MRVIFVAASLLLVGCSDHFATTSTSENGVAGATAHDLEAAGGSPAGAQSAGAGGELAATPTPTFGDEDLPPAQLDRTYEYKFEATGVTGPVEYAALEDSLPVGLSLSSTGVLSGFPHAEGEFILKVQATSAGVSVDAAFQLEVIKNAWLVYRSDDRTPAVNELFAINAGRTASHTAVVINHALAKGEQVSRYFSWSPDGSFVAYSSARAEDTDVYVVDMRGLTPSAPISLRATLPDVRLSGQTDVSWSPDSTAMLVDSQVEDFVVELADSRPVGARRLPPDKYCWQWTPDSGTLICRDTPQASVYALPRDVSPPKTLTGALTVGYGTLTPDGTKLIFQDGDGAIYFSRLTDAAPKPIRVDRVHLSSLATYERPNNDSLIYIASDTSIDEHEVYRASLSDEPRVETLVKGINTDTTAGGMDWRDIRPALLPGGKLLSHRSPGFVQGTLDLNVRVLATGRETSRTISTNGYIVPSNDGTSALVPELIRGGDYVDRCTLTDDGLQQCYGLNQPGAGFEISYATFTPNNDGALLVGGMSGQAGKAFYADMRGDIRSAVALHENGDVVLPRCWPPFSPSGSQLALALSVGNESSIYLIELAGQRPSAPERVSGKGVVTSGSWQPR